MTFAGTERAVAPALVTDLVRREELDRSMALYGAARWGSSWRIKCDQAMWRR
jgi:hypothetical protein